MIINDLLLTGFKTFGHKHTVALLEVNGRRQIYDREGLVSLLKLNSENVDLAHSLNDILNQFDGQRYIELEELQEDDISGQGHLF